MIAGKSNVRTTNERVRTRSRYSRLMISQMLRMCLPRGFDEYLFEGRLHHLKLGNARTCRCQSQQFLGIGSRRQAHFYVVAVIVERFHQWAAQKGIAAFISELHV